MHGATFTKEEKSKYGIFDDMKASSSAIVLLYLGMVAFTPTSGGQALHNCKTGNIYKTADHSDVKHIEVLFTDIHSALVTSDKKKLSELMHYPLSVGTLKGSFTVRSKAEFLGKYDMIISNDLRAFLLRQKARCVGEVGSRGFTLGSGQIWFDEFDPGDFKIFTINNVVYSTD